MDGPIQHFLDGVKIPCLAQEWRRNRKVHEMAFEEKKNA